MQESAWVQLRQAAHHWTTVVTLLIGDPVGVIPLGGTLQDAFNDARVLKNDRRKVGRLFEKGSRFCVIVAAKAVTDESAHSRFVLTDSSIS